jgi:hypothetical protein
MTAPRPAKLVATTVSDTAVHIRLADAINPDHVVEWIDIQSSIQTMTVADQNGEHPLAPLGKRMLATIQISALRHARDAISAEIQRLSNLGGR